jgi:hypothetical protein
VVTENELRKINNEIGKLRASLPALMQFPGGSDLETLQEMERKARWMAAAHKRRGGLELDVKTGSEYPHERSLSTLVPREVLHSLKDERGALDVADASGATIGRLTNPTPLPYDDFVTAFEMCYGSAFVSLEFLRIHSDYKSTEGEIGNDSEWEAWCEVRVTTTYSLSPNQWPAFPCDGRQAT